MYLIEPAPTALICTVLYPAILAAPVALQTPAGTFGVAATLNFLPTQKLPVGSTACGLPTVPTA